MAESLKNLYSKEYIKNLGNKIKEEYSFFEIENFETSIFNESWEFYELKERMRHISNKLNEFLPFSYEKQIEILKPVSKSFEGLTAMVFQDFVEVYGLNDFDNSIKALEVFTINSSSEFAIRAFILKYEKETMSQMKLWAKSSNEHIRRLASEGCRPRLPWAIALPKFKKEPSKVLEILELLKNDKSLYVRKSVANNLNDISKDNPHLLIDFVKKNLGSTKELDWICKHACRTLLKKGDKEVLTLFGYVTSSVNLINFSLNKELNLGDDLNFKFELNSDELLGDLRIEYIIYYLKANGTYSKKNFMISQNSIKSKYKEFSKKQSFKNMTTRKHYEGKHFISIVINGEEKIKKSFILNL